MIEALPELADLAEAVVSGAAGHSIDLTRRIVERLRRAGAVIELRLHPLGFLMLRLGTLADQRIVRLHLWIPNCRPHQEPAWPIHDHVFSYVSCVLVGSLAHLVYETAIVDVGGYALYNVSYEGEESGLHFVDKSQRQKP